MADQGVVDSDGVTLASVGVDICAGAGVCFSGSVGGTDIVFQFGVMPTPAPPLSVGVDAGASDEPNLSHFVVRECGGFGLGVAETHDDHAIVVRPLLLDRHL